MSGIRLLIVPYELGRLRKGVGRGPETLLEAGAEDALAAHGAAVEREVIELDRDFSEHSGDSEVDACVDLMRLISARVRAAVEDGAFPVILSGSCFAAVGVVGGLDEPEPGVAWFDAHADFNSPATTISGYMDGMGLRMLTGGAWQALMADGDGLRAIPETSAVLAGARDFDPPELLDLEASAVNWVKPAALRSGGVVDEIAAMDPSGLYLHLDLDVLDVAEAKVNVFSAPDGITGAELEDLVKAILGRSPVRAVSLTAFDPECDEDGNVPPAAMRVLDAVAAHLAAPT